MNEPIECNIYSINTEKIRFTTGKLLEKLYINDLKGILIVNEEEIHEWDKGLWTFSTNAFIPHTTISQKQTKISQQNGNVKKDHNTSTIEIENNEINNDFCIQNSAFLIISNIQDIISENINSIHNDFCIINSHNTYLKQIYEMQNSTQISDIQNSKQNTATDHNQNTLHLKKFNKLFFFCSDEKKKNEINKEVSEIFNITTNNWVLEKGKWIKSII